MALTAITPKDCRRSRCLAGRTWRSASVARWTASRLRWKASESMASRSLISIVLACLCALVSRAATVVLPAGASPRVEYGAEKLREAIRAASIGDDRTIAVGVAEKPAPQAQ